MLEILKTVNNTVSIQNELCDGCWINVMEPNSEDVNYLVNILGIDESFIMYAIDPEEASRIDIEDEQTLIVVDVPTLEDDTESSVPYSTIPMAMIIIKKYIVTISLKKHNFLVSMASGTDKSVITNMHTRFILQVLYKIANRYLHFLKEIDKMTTYTERQLKKTMRNKEIISLLGFEKSLVYFSTSLKSIEIMLNRISRGRIIKLYEEDEDILDDVIIETKQAIEMCGIYTRTLSSTMDAYSYIISNNLNIAMKTLTSVTLVAAVPTVVSGLYGMNIDGGMPFDSYWWAPLVLAGVISLAVVLLLIKKGMFK